MNTCAQSFETLILRSLGREFGARLLPSGLDITLCDQVFLIASGLIWNIYFAILALALGFFLATAVALGKASPRAWLNRPARALSSCFGARPCSCSSSLSTRPWCFCPGPASAWATSPFPRNG